MEIGFISLGLLIILNIATVAFTYGKLSQQVQDLSRRVLTLETNNKEQFKEQIKELSGLEGRILTLEVVKIDSKK